MLASLMFPTVSALVAEIDGMRPGLSLYDIVSENLQWFPHDVQTGEHACELTFLGRGDNIVAKFTVRGNSTAEEAQRELPFHAKLEVIIKETNTVETRLACEKGGSGFGSVRFEMTRKHGQDISYPIWGYPQIDHRPGCKGAFSEYISNNFGIAYFPTDDQIRGKEKGGAMFLAMIALALAVNWESRVLPRQLPSLSSTSVDLQRRMINARWGD